MTCLRVPNHCTTDAVAYSYDIRFLKGAGIFSSPLLVSSLHDSKDMIISSTEFSTFSDAEKSLTTTLSALAELEGARSGTDFAIVTRVSPKLSGSVVESDPQWDDLTICRLYVADTALLKQSRIAYTVFAHIKGSDQEDLDRLR